MSDDGRAGILIVDDKPAKLLALEAVLEDLKQRIVCANSGREALRHLLHDDFAVILLDVNMPDMDGFECASLIRQRNSSRHVPIIFITALGDETHMARGYSLGAVDYIHAPVIPDVLRSKVSVFVELYQIRAQIHRQSESLRRRATQLQKLSGASIAINSAIAIEQMIQVLADSAREIIGSHQCLAIYTADIGSSPTRRTHVRSAASFSDRHAKWRNREIHLDSLAGAVVAQTPVATRLTETELHDHPDWEIIRQLPVLPHGGLLAAPFKDRDGKNLGLILLLDRCSGEFTSDDEAILTQLAQITTIAIQNAVFAQEREANRLKDEFLATLSHELRTPLNAIVGWTEILRSEQSSPEIQHGLDVIERNVKAQTKLIEDLLDVSRITAGKMRLNMRSITLAPIVEAAVDAIRPVADARRVALSTELAEGISITGDPDRLQQVVWNLLSNAVKFTPAGGQILVSLSKAESGAQIRVADTGQGIEPEFIRFVFDRFRQADSTTTRSHGGLGIGLTIVRHIIELHGGTVTVHSAGIGKGSTFTVTLPTSIPALAKAPQRRDPVTEAPTSPQPELPVDVAGKNVLLVDDEPDAREVLCQILQRAGAAVLPAGSVREAFEQLSKNVPDIIISDLAMPDEDGYLLIQNLRQFPPDRGGRTPAIALTAYTREEDRIRTISAGFQMHLHKPVDPQQLLAAVTHLTRTSTETQRDDSGSTSPSPSNGNGEHHESSPHVAPSSRVPAGSREPS